MDTYADRLQAALATQIKMELVGQAMDQKDLAAAVGIGRPAMNRYLQGHQAMPMKTVVKVAQVLGLKPQTLIERADARLDPSAPTA